MEARLRQALLRADEVGQALADPATAKDPGKLRSLGREHTRLAPVVRIADRLTRLQRELEQARELASESDPELVALAKADLARLPAEISVLTEELHELLLPRDPHDDRDAIVEIRAGTGGDEAALFAADLYRMYQRFSERHGLAWEPISLSEGLLGGLKEAIVAVRGAGAYGLLRRESGVHRVQRVPATETQGRIHTSAATVAVLPEAEEVDVKIEDRDLKIDVFRASGAGGQREALDAERAASRRGQVGSGDRSERIRTYNYPQNRVTDHRINLTLYKLEQVMAGTALDEGIEALISED